MWYVVAQYCYKRGGVCILIYVTVDVEDCNFTDDVWTKKNFSTFSYKLVQISPIMILALVAGFASSPN